jgi:dsDNA-specific endonuclease/ATPase MutS2
MQTKRGTAKKSKLQQSSASGKPRVQPRSVSEISNNVTRIMVSEEREVYNIYIRDVSRVTSAETKFIGRKTSCIRLGYKNSLCVEKELVT